MEDSIDNGLIEVAEVLSAPAAPTVMKPTDPSRLSVPGKQAGDPHTLDIGVFAAAIQGHRRSDSEGRSSSAGRNSEIIIEEEDAEKLHERARENTE